MLEPPLLASACVGAQNRERQQVGTPGTVSLGIELVLSDRCFNERVGPTKEGLSREIVWSCSAEFLSCLWWPCEFICPFTITR